MHIAVSLNYDTTNVLQFHSRFTKIICFLSYIFISFELELLHLNKWISNLNIDFK